mmetsp:Transcript_999/g.2208  ORF Transcript_999/g.2208 Transcript_999/m.2208 type:complete len:110 (+) Transcript_999:115-444(+)|eukprot:CAMPEP_0197196172 /NCGR_PEP_ID=MMETSP1423-20130617/32215_1 /TAXON_ID=476441 /ORGANISM="Pseudo-nitzschia heimii, Strain UNC1101" /LENGTH=109 /DNA_ID=CAMNT_0042649951 /DNA_START=99 /DNA_END=428 /DNA_ORIENTATION=+
MAKYSFLLSALVACLLALSATAFAPLNTCSARPATDLSVNIKVNVGDGEPVESALRRFKRAVSNSGHLMELRHKRYFENSQEKKKRKIKEGRLRKKFERMQRKRMAKRT